jgi:hypothetical protein
MPFPKEIVTYIPLRTLAMKQILWSLLLIGAGAFSQTNAPARPGSEYDGVAGSPYLFKDWVNGTVYYKNGRIVNQFKLKLDVCRNYLLMEFKGQTFAPQVSSITSFVLYPKDSKDSMVFRKGFPPTGTYNNETFYEVLSSGKASLLHILERTIVEEKDLLPSNTKRFFEDHDQYFLLSNGQLIQLIKEDREKLARQFPEHEDALLRFMNEEQLKMKTAADFIRFAEKYNELNK